MLQAFWNWLYPPPFPEDVDPPHLLVRVLLSSTTFSLSNAILPPNERKIPLVTVTLQVQVEGTEPITIHTYSSLLDTSSLPRGGAMFSEGFSFRDVETGEFLSRPSIDICTFSNDYEPGVQEIPPVTSKNKPFEVQNCLYLERWLDKYDQGFEVGRTYEIGFTPAGGCVKWWRMGRKNAWLRSSGRKTLPAGDWSKNYLRFQPVNSATFTVVE